MMNKMEVFGHLMFVSEFQVSAFQVSQAVELLLFECLKHSRFKALFLYASESVIQVTANKLIDLII